MDELQAVWAALCYSCLVKVSSNSVQNERVEACMGHTLLVIVGPMSDGKLMGNLTESLQTSRFLHVAKQFHRDRFHYEATIVKKTTTWVPNMK